MKLFFFTLVILFAPFLSFSQNSDNKDFKRFSMGINISPDFGYRTLKNTNTDQTIFYIVESRNGDEIPKLCFTGGINFTYYFRKNIGLETGINYSNKGYQTTVLGGSGFWPDPVPMYKFIYTYEYIDVPLLATFLLGKKKLQFVAKAGITTNILLKQSVITSYYYDFGQYDKNGKWGGIFAPKSGYLTIGNLINFSGTIALGTNYNLNKNINLNMAPQFSYSILSWHKSPTISEHLWSIGLNMGLSYRF